MKYRAVLFDLDDTLLDSYRTRLNALQIALSSAGISSPSAEELLQNLDGSPFAPIVNRIGADHGVKSDLYAMYQQALYPTPPGLNKLYPGIKSMLESLYARGTKLGVITSRLRQVKIAGEYSGASQELKETGVAWLIEVVVGYEDTTNHKPHPEPVHLALANLSVSPQDSIVVGDSPADIEAGRAAGCRTCLVTWGSSMHRAEDVEADFVAETPDKLVSLLLRRTP